MTDNIEKSNFNPQMLKACTDTSYECAYQQGRADGVREFATWISNAEYVANHDSFILPLRGYFTIDEIVSEWEKEQLKEQKNG